MPFVLAMRKTFLNVNSLISSLITVLLCSAAALAQDLSQRIDRLEAASKAAQSNIDNAWVLICYSGGGHLSPYWRLLMR